MSRFVPLVCAVALAGAAAIAAQDRPNFSGMWSLVPDPNRPTANGAFGKSFKIDQSATTVTIEQTVTVMGSVRVVSGQMPTATPPSAEEQRSTVYVADGVEREVPRTPLPTSTNPNMRMMVLGSSTYRATWTTGQFVLITFSRFPNPTTKVDELQSVRRHALSIDADGSLIVDGVTVRTAPRPNGPKEEPPVVIRSVYKKAQ